MSSDGSCPTCGHRIATDTEPPRSVFPWHFWLLVVALAVYLGWRLVQLIGALL